MHDVVQCLFCVARRLLTVNTITTIAFLFLCERALAIVATGAMLHAVAAAATFLAGDRRVSLIGRDEPAGSSASLLLRSEAR